MRNINIVKMIMGVLLSLTLFACKEEPVADRIVGTYSGQCTAYTHLEGRDTAIVTPNATLVITKVDDETVKVSLKSSRWGEATFEQAAARNLNTIANLSGYGTYLTSGGQSFEAEVGGTISYESKAVAVTAYVKNHSPKLNLTFTNIRYY